MDEADTHDLLLRWVNTFNLPAKCDKFEALDDGVVLSHVFHEIAPDMFPVLEPVGDNTLLKYGNLRRLYQCIKSFFELDIGMLCSVELQGGKSLEDQVLLSDIRMLIHYALVSAIRCEAKAKFVPAIMEFDAHDQQLLMLSIQEMEGQMVPVHESDEEQDEDGEDWNVGNAADAFDAAAVDSLMEEKAEMEKEMEELNRKLVQLEQEKVEWLVHKKNMMSELALQSQGGQAHRQSHDQEVEELREQLDEMEYTLSKTNVELARVKRELKDAATARKRLEEDNDILTEEAKEVKILRKQVQVLENQNKESMGASREIMDLRDELELSQTRVRALQDDLAKSKKSQDEWKGRVRAMELEAMETQVKMENAESALTKALEGKRKAESEVRALREDAAQVRASGVFAPIQGETLGGLDFQAEVGASMQESEELREAKEKVAELEARLQLMQDKLKETMTSKFELSSKVDELSEKLVASANNSSAEKLEKLEAENKRLQQLYSESREQLKKSAAGEASSLKHEQQREARASVELDALQEKAQSLHQRNMALMAHNKRERTLLMTHFYNIARVYHTEPRAPAVHASPLARARLGLQQKA